MRAMKHFVKEILLFGPFGFSDLEIDLRKAFKANSDDEDADEEEGEGHWGRRERE